MTYSRKPYRAKNLLCNILYINNINENETGRLDITVFHEEFKTPLPNALVKIYKITVSGEYNEMGEGKRIYQFITDANGKVPVTKLPILNELMPDNNDFYYVAVHAANHYSAYVFNAEIYPAITTKFDISLKFIYTNEEYFQFIMQPTRSDIVAPKE